MPKPKLSPLIRDWGLGTGFWLESPLGQLLVTSFGLLYAIALKPNDTLYILANSQFTVIAAIQRNIKIDMQLLFSIVILLDTDLRLGDLPAEEFYIFQGKYSPAILIFSVGFGGKRRHHAEGLLDISSNIIS